MSEEKTEKQGKLFIVSVPIGNKDDFTMRAMNILKHCDLVVCEEIKIGARILHSINLKKPLESLNEQNEAIRAQELIFLLRDGKRIALISDCGTPLLADPGYELVTAAINQNIDIEVAPGVTSIMPALVQSGFPANEFLYAGFLNRNTKERINELRELSNEKRTVCFMETPYRLLPMLEDCTKVMPNRKAYIGMNLTMPYETHHYGTFSELFKKFKEERIKAEFVVVFEGKSNTYEPKKFAGKVEKFRFRPGQFSVKKGKFSVK